MTASPSSRRPQSMGEEIANSITHGLGVPLSIAALVLMVIPAAQNGSAWQVVGVSIFGASLILLYLISCLCHALARTRAAHVFQVLDHSFIFILIAGTYTPFTLVNMRGPWGWSLFGAVWGIAALGIVLKAIYLPRFNKSTSALYLVMGWLVLFAFHKVLETIPPASIAWLIAGGLCYTLGVGFFLTDHRLRYGHAIWHLCVLAGSACHFIAVQVGVLTAIS